MSVWRPFPGRSYDAWKTTEPDDPYAPRDEEHEHEWDQDGTCRVGCPFRRCEHDHGPGYCLIVGLHAGRDLEHGSVCDCEHCERNCACIAWGCEHPALPSQRYCHVHLDHGRP